MQQEPPNPAAAEGSHGYSESMLISKLHKLNDSAQSIQTISHWIRYHKKRCKQSCQIVGKETMKAKAEKKLWFLYLINDILQTSKRKSNDFCEEFAGVLTAVMPAIYGDCNEKTRSEMSRLLTIWRDRESLAVTAIDTIEESLKKQSGGDASASSSSAAPQEVPLKVQLERLSESSLLQGADEERQRAVRETFLSGNFMASVTDCTDLTQLQQEAQLSTRTLMGIVERLQSDLQYRQQLVVMLGEAIQTQDKLCDATLNKIQEFKKYIGDTTKAQEKLQILIAASEQISSVSTEDLLEM